MNNINWIEINLPWAKTDISDIDGPKYIDFEIDFSKDEKEIFGISLSEIQFKVSNAWQYFSENIKAPELYGDFIEKNPNDPIVIQYEKDIDLRDKILEWRNQDSRMIAYQKECENLRREIRKRSFTGLGLNKPGTMIQMENNNIYLIGDICENGGTSDEWMEFSSNDIVKKYAILV